MSRTYRRKGNTGASRQWYWGDPLAEYCVDINEIDISQVETATNSRSGWWYRGNGKYDPGQICDVLYKRKSVEGKKRLAKFHSDAGTHGCKEPGPAWWRNMTAERPNRRKAKRELQKYLVDNEYEPIIEAKPRLEYWT